MDRNSAESTDVVVVGAGLVGLAAAAGCARRGQRVTLVRRDPVPAPRAADAPWDLRVYAVSPASRALLDSLGAWQKLDVARIAPVYDMRVHSASELHFGAYEAGIEALAWIVEQDNLGQALETVVRAAGVTERENAAVARVDLDTDPDAAALVLDSGEELRARLIVAADGADSPVRGLVGIGFTEQRYPQRALVAHFETEHAHRDCAYQWFGEHGILALLPLPAAHDRDRCSMVWAAPLSLADELEQCTPEQLARRVEGACGGALGAMVPFTAVASFPLRRRAVTTLLAPRLALVGDAAHVVHPLAGQGMNLGLGDVADLLAALGAESDEPCADPGARLLLRRYERARAEPVAMMGFVTDALQRLFDPASAAALGPLGEPIIALRELGWRVVAGVAPLKRFLVARAIN